MRRYEWLGKRRWVGFSDPESQKLPVLVFFGYLGKGRLFL